MAERVLKNSKVSTENGGNKVVMKSLEGYFENLVDDAINKKSVLEKLVANNAKLATTNEDVVAIVFFFPNKIKNIERETYRLKKTGAIGASQGKRNRTLFPHCKNEGYHAPDACFEITKNKENRPPGWKSWL